MTLYNTSTFLLDRQDSNIVLADVPNILKKRMVQL